MVTTIQLDESTRNRLASLKGSRTYDEVIRELLDRKQGKPSRFGVHPRLRWRSTDRMRFRDE